jgi:hypothetical protein
VLERKSIVTSDSVDLKAGLMVLLWDAIMAAKSAEMLVSIQDKKMAEMLAHLMV